MAARVRAVDRSIVDGWLSAAEGGDSGLLRCETPDNKNRPMKPYPAEESPGPRAILQLCWLLLCRIGRMGVGRGVGEGG